MPGRLTRPSALRQWWRNWELAVIWSVGLFALPLGYLGFREQNLASQAKFTKCKEGNRQDCGEPPRPDTVLDLAYKTVQLFVLESGYDNIDPTPPTLEAARIGAPLVTVYHVAKAFFTLFAKPLSLMRIRRWRHHSIVLGLNRQSLRVVRALRATGERVVVVDHEMNPEMERQAHALGTQMHHADPRLTETLYTLRVARAGRLIIVGSEDDENLEMAVIASEVVRRNRKPDHLVRCFVQTSDLTLTSSLQRDRVLPLPDNSFEIEIINGYKDAASSLFRNHLLKHAPVGESDPRSFRVFVMGCGHLGQAIITHLAQTACFANEKQLELVIVDLRGEEALTPLLLRLPGLKAACAVRCLTASAHEASVIAEVRATARDPKKATVVIFCLSRSATNLAGAVSLHSALGDLCPPLFLRGSDRDDVDSLLPGSAAGLVAFANEADKCADAVLDMERRDVLAADLHELYRQARTREGDDPNCESMRPWATLVEELRDSNRQSEAHWLVKKAARDDAGNGTNGQTRDSIIERLGRLEHHRWMTERLLTGWTLGPRDITAHTSPFLVPWDQLDGKIQEYDRELVRELLDREATKGG